MLTRDFEKIVYSRDARIEPTALPDYVVRPRNIEEVQKIIRFINSYPHKFPIYIRSSSTGYWGGGFRSGYKDLSIELAALRAFQVKRIGAEILASSCPFCHYNLELGRDNVDKNIKVVDITELIRRHLL